MADDPDSDRQRRPHHPVVTTTKPVGILHRLQTTAGVVSVASIEAAFAISLAALIVSDVSPDGLPRLMGSLLVGSALVAVIAGLCSSLPGTIATAQDTPVVLLAAVVAPLIATVDPANQAATVLVFVGLSGVFTGVVALALGAARLGYLVRFLPTPVLDGFRLGTGWLLVVGGLAVAADGRLALDRLHGVVLWSVVLAGAVALVLAITDYLPRASAYLGVGIVVVGAGFVAVGAETTSLDEIVEAGWLLSTSDANPTWRPMLVDITDADWGAVVGQTPALLAVAFISITGLLLNTGSIEAELDVDADIDRELRATGSANLLGGLAGSSPSYVMFSGTMLAQRLQLRTRTTSALVGVGIFLCFVIGAAVVGYTPRFLAGGLLAGLGVQLIVGWVAAVRREARGDAGLALLVAVVIGAIGVLEGVAAGIVLAAVVFVRRYGQINPVRRISTGTATFSRVDRHPALRTELAALAPTVTIIELEGYLFFGSAARVAKTVRRQITDETTHVLLDFVAVTGLDGSARRRLQQLADRLERADVTVWYTGEQSRSIAPDETYRDDLDHGVEAIEQSLLGATAIDQSHDEPLATLLIDAPSRSLAPGEQLFAPGDPSDGFALVVSGRISIWLERDDRPPVRIRQIGPGALIGELGFVTGDPRSARAAAEEQTDLRVVDRAFVEGQGDDFERVLNRLLLRHVSARLTATNDLVRSLSR
ncbi:MAG: SulP family inorganic anion transporter [Actinomycetota bacterium]